MVGAEPVRQLLRDPPERDHDLEVDVEVVVVLPPREVRVEVGLQAGVEDRLLLLGQPRARRVDRGLPLGHRVAGGRLEVVVLLLEDEGLDQVERDRVVLDPAGHADVAGRLLAVAVDLQEVVEVGEPHRRGTAVGRERGPQVATGVVREHLAETGLPGLDRELVELPVGLHDLGVLALEELADVGGVDAHLGTRPVEAQEVHQQRVHHSEVDLHRALVVAPGLVEQGREVSGGRGGEVDALEVLPRGLQLVAARRPRLLVVLQEPGEVRAEPVGPGPDLAGVGLGDRGAVEVGAREAGRDATPGRQRQRLGGVLGAPAVAVLPPGEGGKRGHPARPVEVEVPELVLVRTRERPGAVDDVGRGDVLGLEARVPLTRVGLDWDDVGHDDLLEARGCAGP
ncbi:hypothetical protein [Pseudonocardia sp. T1-2H]|uniref:hypothetical protein n=1 Tax=Pseudonocardia sp. T1-2H TaxID=3128899 RepID=UPI00310154E0